MRKNKEWRRWAVLPSSLLVAVGAFGFFGSGVSAVGALNWLPASFEWPAGEIDRAVTMLDGTHIVLLRGAGRVQVYDPHGQFVRGWPVGSALNLRLLPDGTVEVLTKGEQGLVFDRNGRLIAHRVYPTAEFVSLENSILQQTTVSVETSPWFYVFSSPFLSALVMVAGLLGWYAVWPRPDPSGQ